MRRFCCLFLLLVCAAPTSAQRVLFVDADAAGAADGTSWADAFVHLQDALDVAEPDDEVWVAEGTYRPDRGTTVTLGARNAYFDLRSGVALYGGFAGTETDRAARDWQAHPTILSGDLAGNDGEALDPDAPARAENTFHVVTAGDVDAGPADETAVLDGFYITGGNANAVGIDPNNTGGGLYVILSSRPTLRNLVVERNTARFGGGFGAVAAHGNPAAFGDGPAVSNVVFRDNVASQKGGGAWLFVSDPVFRSVRFEGNRSAVDGGGLYTEGSAAFVHDAVFVGNEAIEGGGIYHDQDNSVVTNTRVLGNEALLSGGGVYVRNVASQADGVPAYMNVVVAGNRALGEEPGRGGGGLYLLRKAPYLTNLVVVGNRAEGEGGGLHLALASPLVVNSILWQNTAAGAEAQLHLGGFGGATEPIVANSLVEGGLPAGTLDGGANFDADPLFENAEGADGIFGTEDDDFRLLPGSPAIDAGENRALLFDLLDLDGDGDTREGLPIDLAGRQRIFDGGSGTALVDVGAYEFGAPPVATGIEPEPEEIPETPIVLAAYPNPFRTTATIRYALPEAGPVTLRVFDALGRLVATLAEGVQAAGPHEARLDGTALAGGLYLFHLEAAGTRTVHTLIHVR